MNRKIKIFTIVCVFFASVFTIFQSPQSKLQSSIELLMQNVEALADNENGYGWLWEKEWVACQTLGSITIYSNSAGIATGTYAYSTELVTQIQRQGISATIIAPGPGKKSYCYDGWSFCSKDECR